MDSVPRGSRAEAAGLAPGDTIVAVNELPITCEALFPAVALRSEAQLSLTVERDDAAEPITIDLPLAGEAVVLGMSWREDSAEPGAVYVTRVVPHSPAAAAGVGLFDRIYALDGVPLAGQTDLLDKVRELLNGNTSTLSLELESRGQLRETTISLALPTEAAGDISL